ncbi:MAG: hypothetical protein IBX55_13070 [Methyloprofundus sp.]|nr:hypothetical protein [Methyloprofundus sp.]
MEKTEELAQAISDCVEMDIATGQRSIDSSAIPCMIDQLNKSGWLDPIKAAALAENYRTLDEEAEKPSIYFWRGFLSGAITLLIWAAIFCTLN